MILHISSTLNIRLLILHFTITTYNSPSKSHFGGVFHLTTEEMKIQKENMRSPILKQNITRDQDTKKLHKQAFHLDATNITSSPKQPSGRSVASKNSSNIYILTSLLIFFLRHILYESEKS